MGERTKAKKPTAEAERKKQYAVPELPDLDPADPYAALRLDAQLCFPLYAASRKIVNLYTPYLKPLGITYTQYIVFLALWQDGDMTVGDLCKKLYLDSGTLTPLLKKMEEKGYVRRIRCPEDERCVSIQLTREGQEMKEKVRDVPEKVGACVRMDPAQAQQLHSLLYQILETVC